MDPTDKVSKSKLQTSNLSTQLDQKGPVSAEYVEMSLQINQRTDNVQSRSTVCSSAGVQSV